ncbi:ABC transporter ATP-binding protein/permease [Fulvivirgaceae bacterium PWU4]|uniref:ABC transporter ATP-binding protein/permease n=1 Tax=Chryseosolibacter histidini TaxID=2782349 RepID=A0AAP2DPM2_9BACT|nr:ABC transporter ATP-binding protein [Chryseosolibacter histidini]MBT1700166.1 ABC transporter ATP-binding protein/permease [Chryseosolibacter histidini]
MKVYLRILRYAPNLAGRMIQFLIYSVLGIIFSVANIALVIPMLNMLFGYTQNKAPQVAAAMPRFSLSLDFVLDVFDYYFMKVIREHGPMNALLFICVSIIISVVLTNLFRYMERMVASRLKVDIVKNIRMHIFRNVSELHIGYFNNQRKGDLISRFTNDVVEVENAVVNSLKFVMKEPITIIVYFGVLFFISVKLTLFTLLLLPITGGILAEIIKRLKRKAKQSQESQGRIVNILDETFSGMRVILAFNARPFILKKIDDETSYHRRTNLSIARKNELASPVSETLGVIIVSGIIFFGGSLVLGENSTLTPGEFLGFLGIFAQIIQPAKNFSNGVTSVQKGTVSAQRIFDVIDTTPVIRNKPDAKPLPEFNHGIEFRNVSFAYDKDHVLRNINLKIEKGKTIALVGPSGGGKSTLADLIPRFYDPAEGEVTLDGVPLPDYDIESLRKQMGVVTQESILFNDTIFNNIAFGMENVNEEDVIRAAKVANAHDFIMQTPQGYQTLIGERGSKLSGGQRQRLSIARAVLKNPPILILDEATSALDSESERLVQDALNNLMKNRTSIVIAHRLSTIQHADEIIVIQNGQIIERGRHDALILQSGLYRKLNEIQKV